MERLRRVASKANVTDGLLDLSKLVDDLIWTRGIGYEMHY